MPWVLPGGVHEVANTDFSKNVAPCIRVYHSFKFVYRSFFSPGGGVLRKVPTPSLGGGGKRAGDRTRRVRRGEL